MLSKKTFLFFVTAFILFAVDLGCTYTTLLCVACPSSMKSIRYFAIG